MVKTLSPGARPGNDELCSFRMLREAGLPARGLEYAYTPHGGTMDAARQLGIPENTVIKTLVFTDQALAGPNAVIALMHGTRRVSLRKLERLAAAKHLRPCSPAEAEALTGLEVGGISPFGLEDRFMI